MKKFLMALVVGLCTNVGTAEVVVSGTGTVDAVPDTATVVFVVSAQNADSGVASDAVRKNTIAAIVLCKEMGVEQKNIKTLSYTMQPAYETNKNGSKPRLVGYQVAHRVSVLMPKQDAEFKQTGKLVSALSATDPDNLATAVQGITFSVSNVKELAVTARKKAVADAKAKATTLTEEANTKLGDVTSITESEDYNMPMRSGRSFSSLESAPGGGADGMPLLGGEQKVTITVNMTFKTSSDK